MTDLPAWWHEIIERINRSETAPNQETVTRRIEAFIPLATEKTSATLNKKRINGLRGDVGVERLSILDPSIIDL